MSRTVTTMRDGILLNRIARDLGAGRAGSVLVTIIIPRDSRTDEGRTSRPWFQIADHRDLVDVAERVHTYC
eukprot:556983-Pyramimonas_sp.AAC.2